MALAPDVGRHEGETLASAVFDALRRGLITGGYAPGEKLKVRQLADRFGTGLSPVREALNRLMHDGLVLQSDLRGFSVAPATEADLDDLTAARCWASEQALRESIARGDAAWEERVLVGYHRMSRIEQQGGDAARDTSAWDLAHSAFHLSLIEACGSPRLVSFCAQLYDAADRYRHLARHAPGAALRDRAAEHRAILDATLARDADLAARLLVGHFQATADLCREELRRISAQNAAAKRKPRTAKIRA